MSQDQLNTMKFFAALTFIGAVGLAVRPVSALPGEGRPAVHVPQQTVQRLNEDVIKETNNASIPELFENEEDSVDFPGGGEIVPQGKVSYHGNQLWKVVLDNDNKAVVIVKLRDRKDISIWGGNHTAVDILVKPSSVEKVKEVLHKHKIHHIVLQEDLQRIIDLENPPISEEDEELTEKQGHRLTWHSYHRIPDIHGFLDYLATSYPNLCTVQDIGTSVEGRPLKLLKISNKRPGNKAVWVDGGMHAREWITPATVTYIINQLVENFEREPQEIQNIDWHFLPLANPDGYEHSHVRDRLWRKNRARAGQCAGTDLNRNFGYKWGGKGASKNPCQETYGGVGPFSEPETAAIRNYITSQGANWQAYVSYHSYGQFILFPWGYDRVVPPDYKDLQAIGNKAASAMQNTGGAAYRVGPSGSTLYPASGGSDDWAKGTVHMKYAYTIELRDQGTYGFILPAHYILPTAKEALAALKVIGAAASVA